MITDLTFPEKFIWGAATAAYQVEGAAFEDGRSESIWDRFAHTPGKVINGENGDISVDHYHRMTDDIKLMKQLNLQAYRFSISWSRVLPEGRGRVNRKGIDFYNRLVDNLLEAGILPFVTLYHWDLPSELQNAGGWLNRRICDWFTEYAQLMYKSLGDRVNFWCTHNEPNIFSLLGYYFGKHAPGVTDYATFRQVCHHVLLSHGDAVKAARALLPNAKIGIVPAISMDYAVNESDEDSVNSLWNKGPGYFLEPIFTGRYPRLPDESKPVICDGDMERIHQPIDFIGINHYFSNWLTKGDDGRLVRIPKDLPVTDRDWIVYPHGMHDMLMEFKKRCGDIPVYIMENGASYPDTVTSDGQIHDSERTEYYRGYITALYNAIDCGVNVRGYFAWSLMDNFEWEMGYQSRFGIVHVDFRTLKRTIKDSGIFYSNVIRNNGIVCEF